MALGLVVIIALAILLAILAVPDDSDGNDN